MVATEKMLPSGRSCSPVVLAFASTQLAAFVACVENWVGRPNFIPKSANLRDH